MKSAKPPANNIGRALKSLRNLKGVSQEDFSLISSRTYISSLERGLKSPTLNKVDELATVLNVHPLSLLLLGYCADSSSASAEKLLERLSNEVRTILA